MKNNLNKFYESRYPTKLYTSNTTTNSKKQQRKLNTVAFYLIAELFQ